MSSAEHYKPQHPLPQEIQDLSRNDTICQFCGVSYLIHNEIKRLEERLQACDEEIKRLKTFDEREMQLKSEIERLNTKHKELKDVLNIANERNVQIQNELVEKKTKIFQLDHCLLERDDSIVLLENRFKNKAVKEQQLCIQLEKFYKDLLRIREELYSMKVSYKDLQNNFSALTKNFQDSWQVHVTKYIQALHLSYEKKNEQLEIAMDNLKRKCRKELDEMNNNHAKMEKHMKENYFKDLSEKEGKMKQIHTEEMNGCKMENESLKIQLRELQDNFNSSCDESSRVNKALQNEISMLNSKLKTLEENQSHHTKELLHSVQKIRKEKDFLQEEKQRMIDTHQRRIQELRESFLQKLNEAEKWPSKLDDALKNQQLKFNEEKNQLWKELVDSHNQINLEKEKEYKQKMLKERKKYEETERELNIRMKSSGKKLEERIQCLQKQLSESQFEKDRLSKSFSENQLLLQREIEQLQTNACISSHLAGNEERVKELENALSLVKGELNRKINTIEEHENEMQVLRDCVRRECEERYELTESLAEARTELLAYQRCYGNSKTVKQEVVPSPPIYGRKSSKLESNINDFEITRRNSNCTVNRRNSQDDRTKSLESSPQPKTDNSEKSRKRIDIAVGRYAKGRLKINKFT